MRRTHENSLSVVWSKKENDLLFWHDKHKCDGHLLYSFFCQTKTSTGRTLDKELEERGFDLKTLRFSIVRKS